MTQETTLEPRQPEGPRPDRTRQATVAALRAEVTALETELERREQRHEQVVDRYETLLAEQAQSRRDGGTFVWTGTDSTDDPTGPLAALRSLF